VAAVDPRDPAAVAAAIAGWASDRFGGPVEVVGTPAAIGGGFDSYIHAIDLTGDARPPGWRVPLVVRMLPSADRAPQAAKEAAVQGWCAEQGYSAPHVLAVLQPDELTGLPTQVMERASGTTMLGAATSAPWKTRRLIDQLAGLALTLHALPSEGWPGPTDPIALVDQRLSMPRRVVDEVDAPGLREALDRATALGPRAVEGPPVVCHGDFHPLNVMVDGDQASVIDWTDAGLGPREADVSRTLLLFNIAAIAAHTRVERIALRLVGPRLERRYRRTYLAGATLDPVLLRRWEVLHAVHGWAQVAMLHAGGFKGSTSADAAGVPVSLVDFLRGRIDQALAGER
jgi:aminoglycoside phosphotransferase (APT) family kinase protein